MVKKKPHRRKSNPASNDETIGETIARECAEKLNHLMKAYEIEDGDYFSLALRLAIDHVPHFRTRIHKNKIQKAESELVPQIATPINGLRR